MNGELNEPNPRHPGRTAAQRRALDAIGCGNHSPLMLNSTREALLSAEMIVELAPRRMSFSGSLTMTVRQFEMPPAVHMMWCKAMAAENPDDL